MLIELIGPAGSGKTTLAHRAERILREQGEDVLSFADLERLEAEIGTRSFRDYSVATRRRTILGLALRCPGIILPILLLSFLHGPEESSRSRKRRKRRKRHARRVLGHVRMALALRKMAADRLILLHEGFTQVLWTLLIDSPSLRAKWLIRFALSRYHAVVGQHGVRLIIDDKTAAKRVFDRDETGRFNRESSDEQRCNFPRWLAYHRTLVALLPPTMIEKTIDVSNPSDHVTRELVALIEAAEPAPEPMTLAAPGLST